MVQLVRSTCAGAPPRQRRLISSAALRRVGAKLRELADLHHGRGKAPFFPQTGTSIHVHLKPGTQLFHLSPPMSNHVYTPQFSLPVEH
jgi:hypothetical protein